MSKDFRDVDSIPGERWFPKKSEFLEDMKDYWGDWGVASEVTKLKAVLMRRPGKEIEDFDYNEVRFRAPIDVDKFREEHDNLAQIYKRHDVAVHYVENQREDRPNAVFMRDLVFMTPEGAIVTRPAMEQRRGEERYVAEALAKLGVPIVRTITGDGIFEGANGMWVDRKTVILATGSRTNRSAYSQIEYDLRRMGVEDIIPMPIPYGHAHIDGLLNFASEDTVMIHAPQVPYDVCEALMKKGIKILEAPSQTEAKDTLGVNFVALEPGLVIQPEGNPRCREELEKNNIKVIPIDFSEILKGWGAIHCATVFLKRE
ncbi:arginine deiminase family protein [Proteinivorax tanatarense]|uniref:Arginine deiminase family protein n=1 Tax=Proteinivorax tanatarense TaxID=1260629 RepID=A0AAU7VHG4_9FIRM